jgi:hypothetical protein
MTDFVNRTAESHWLRTTLLLDKGLAMASTKTTALGLLVVIWSLTTTGCFWGLTTQGPSLGILSIPIPVSPYFQDQKEDEFWEHERYERVPILGPTTSGGPPIALDAPSDDEVMRALEKTKPVEGGIPCMWERNRNNVRIVKHKIADPTAPRTLQVHHLLRGRPPRRLARAAHPSR